MALAALLRIINDEPGAPESPLNEEELSWPKAQLTPDWITWIQSQQSRVLSDGAHSELYELWEEGNSLDEWLKSSGGYLRW